MSGNGKHITNKRRTYNRMSAWQSWILQHFMLLDTLLQILLLFCIGRMLIIKCHTFGTLISFQKINPKTIMLWLLVGSGYFKKMCSNDLILFIFGLTKDLTTSVQRKHFTSFQHLNN